MYIYGTVFVRNLLYNLICTQMSQYNKSEIFKNAWKLFRETGVSFSDCLTQSWNEAKGFWSGLFTEKNMSDSPSTSIKPSPENKFYSKINSINKNHELKVLCRLYS